MKKRGILCTAAFCSALAITGCATGQIEVVKDDFKNTSMVKMELNHYAGVSSMANAIYTREFAGAKKGPVIINYAISVSAGSGNLESKAIIKADDKTFDIAFSDISGEVLTRIQQQKTTTNTADENGFVDYTKSQTAVTGISATSNKIFRTKLLIPDAAEKAILASKTLALRAYFGTEPATYTIDGGDLQSIKDFLQSTPVNIVKTVAPASKSEKPKY